MLALILQYRYFILLPLTILEGPIIAFIVGVLIFSGYLAIVPSAILLFLGDFLPDTVYYFIGYFAHEKSFIQKFGKKFGLTPERESFIKEMWHTHTKKTLFLSKLAYGLSTPFLITAGIARYPFRKFIVGTMLVTVLQYGVLMTLGYYLGASYSSVSTELKEVGVAVAIITSILIFFAYRKFTKKIAETLIEKEK